MHDAVVRSFGITPPRKKSKLSEPLINIPTEKILETLRGAISIVVFARSPELRKIKENEWKISEILKQFEIILKKYRPQFHEELQEREKKPLIARLREELEVWETESSTLLEEYSIKEVRVERNSIIKKITTPYSS